ncbi:MAG: IS1 family transposase [Patescibacteria group bacterium]|nr:IS1 family transposase [Patescibacteria group bacterium]
MKSRIIGRFQLSTDGFTGYTQGNGAVIRMFGYGIDYGYIQKMFGRPPGLGPERRYSPPVCISVEKKSVLGNPDPTMICTSHIERQNLNVRIFNRRFTRLTLGFSKKLENLKHSVALLVAYHNFCRVHSTHRMTPAKAAGLTDHQWTIEELLKAN